MIYELGERVKVKNHDGYYEIISIDEGQLTVSDWTGNQFVVLLNEIKEKCTNKELYGHETDECFSNEKEELENN